MACFQSDGIEPEVRDFFKYDCQNGGYISSTFFKDSTMYFIRTFGLVGVDVFQEIFNTVNMDTDVIHLWMRAGPLFGIGVSVTGVNSL